jgi:iron-sulfur cluster repair protein YtfE (RIC family)
MNEESFSCEVFEKIEQEHESLRSNLGHVHSVLDDRGVSREELLSQLNHLRTALVDHFWNEENEGFFDEVTAHAPTLVPQAHKLCAEHQEMMREASELVRFATAGAASEVWWRELKSRFQVFSKQLMHHESEENSLLQQAL